MEPVKVSEGPNAPSRPRTIFRSEAMRVYVEANSRPVLPRFTTPFALTCCWLLVGLLGIGTAVVWFSDIPMTASGEAVVVTGQHQDSDGGLVALVILPPERAGELRAGDEVTLRFGTHTEIRPLTSIEATVLDPERVRERYGLSGREAASIAQPSIVGMVRIDALPGDSPDVIYPGAIGSADVVVGSQRIAASLPVIGGLFR